MRAFLIGCAAAILIAGVSAVVLESLDMSSSRVYSSDSVRLD